MLCLVCSQFQFSSLRFVEEFTLQGRLTQSQFFRKRILITNFVRLPVLNGKFGNPIIILTVQKSVRQTSI